MDLSGLYIAGTGQYSVQEISPPSVAGQLLDDNEFLLDDASWSKGDGWSISDGKARCDGSQSTFSVLEQLSVPSASGKFYKVVYKISDYGAGQVRFVNAGALNFYDTWITADGVYTTFFDGEGATVRMQADADFIGSVDFIYLEEVNEGAPLLDKGDTYLECTASGTVAFPSDQAYGEWEFYWYVDGGQTGDGRIQFIATTPKAYPDVDCYLVDWYASSGPRLAEISGVSFITLARTDADWADPDTWYRIKVTRTLNGEFTFYIRGGNFGNNDWTLVSTTGGSGTNPVTDTTLVESMYIGLDFNAGDRIANLITRKAVQQ
jgi:hypothetical protein